MMMTTTMAQSNEKYKLVFIITSQFAGGGELCSAKSTHACKEQYKINESK